MAAEDGEGEKQREEEEEEEEDEEAEDDLIFVFFWGGVPKIETEGVKSREKKKEGGKCERRSHFISFGAFSPRVRKARSCYFFSERVYRLEGRLRSRHAVPAASRFSGGGGGAKVSNGVVAVEIDDGVRWPSPHQRRRLRLRPLVLVRPAAPARGTRRR